MIALRILNGVLGMINDEKSCTFHLADYSNIVGYGDMLNQFVAKFIDLVDLRSLVSMVKKCKKAEAC